MKLIVLHRVWPALVQSAEWYQLQSEGLGAEFIDAVVALSDIVAQNPQHFPVVHLDARRAVMSRFPFGMYFVIRPDSIYVFAISHLHRNPKSWQRWIPKSRPHWKR